MYAPEIFAVRIILEYCASTAAFSESASLTLRYVCFDVVERGFRVCKRSRNVRNGLSSAYRRNSAVVSRLQRLKRRFVIISLVERVEILFKLVFRSALCGFQLLRVRLDRKSVV